MKLHPAVLERFGKLLIIYFVAVDEADQDSKVIMAICSTVSAKASFQRDDMRSRELDLSGDSPIGFG